MADPFVKGEIVVISSCLAICLGLRLEFVILENWYDENWASINPVKHSFLCSLFISWRRDR